MNWISRIWGGPFRTPPLQHPITVGWVLLKLFETIWRLLLIVVIVAVLVGGWAWYSQSHPLASQVEVDVAQYSPECKDPEYPVRVVVRNNSKKTLGAFDLEFRLYEQGKTENVVPYGSRRSEFHDILKPGYQIESCFRMPEAEPGSTGPYLVAADVTYAAELSEDVPVPVAPPPIITPRDAPAAPPPIVRTNTVGRPASEGNGSEAR